MLTEHFSVHDKLCWSAFFSQHFAVSRMMMMMIVSKWIFLLQLYSDREWNETNTLHAKMSLFVLNLITFKHRCKWRISNVFDNFSEIFNCIQWNCGQTKKCFNWIDFISLFGFVKCGKQLLAQASNNCQSWWWSTAAASIFELCIQYIVHCITGIPVYRALHGVQL